MDLIVELVDHGGACRCELDELICISNHTVIQVITTSEGRYLICWLVYHIKFK